MDDEFKNPERTKGQDNSEKKKREEALITGRLIWESFRQQFVSTPAKPKDIPGRFIALRDKLKKEVTHPEVLKTMLDMVDEAILKADFMFPDGDKKRLKAAKRSAWSARAAQAGPRTSPRGGPRGTRPETGDAGGASGFDPAQN
jgi:hypothetical protein